MFDGRAPDERTVIDSELMYREKRLNALFELLAEAFVYLHAQVIHCVLIMRQHDRCIVVG